MVVMVVSIEISVVWSSVAIEITSTWESTSVVVSPVEWSGVDTVQEGNVLSLADSLFDVGLDSVSDMTFNTNQTEGNLGCSVIKDRSSNGLNVEWSKVQRGCNFFH